MQENHITTFSCPDIRPGRGVGNTIRQADFAIQQLFEGKTVYIEDHCYLSSPNLRGSRNTKKHSKHLLDIILNRFKNEYRISPMQILQENSDMYILVPNVRQRYVEPEPNFYKNKI